MAIKVYTASGTVSQSKVTLSKNILATEIKNHELLKQVYLSEQNNARGVIADTKKRGEVSGGGKKPWRQKGTGRARFGSSRNPIWRGGGVVFGPDTNRNFRQKTNAQAKKTALRQALSLAEKDNRISYIESLKSDGKTKTVANLLKKINFESGLIVLAELPQEIFLSLRNIPGIEVVRATKLSVSNVLESNQILFTKDALEIIDTRLGIKK